MKYAIEQMPTMTILPKDLARALGDTRSQKNLHQFIRRHARGNKHGNVALWMHGKAGRSACVWSLQHGGARQRLYFTEIGAGSSDKQKAFILSHIVTLCCCDTREKPYLPWGIMASGQSI